jgi:transposase-like protein
MATLRVLWPPSGHDLRNRRVADILIAVVEGLKGFPDAINNVFPKRRWSRPASSI